MTFIPYTWPLYLTHDLYTLHMTFIPYIWLLYVTHDLCTLHMTFILEPIMTCSWDVLTYVEYFDIIRICIISEFNPCESDPCQQGGTCVGNGFGFYCWCSYGTSGVNCEITCKCCRTCYMNCRFTSDNKGIPFHILVIHFLIILNNRGRQWLTIWRRLVVVTMFI